jgi:hypothetical protein
MEMPSGARQRSERRAAGTELNRFLLYALGHFARPSAYTPITIRHRRRPNYHRHCAGQAMSNLGIEPTATERRINDKRDTGTGNNSEELSLFTRD